MLSIVSKCIFYQLLQEDVELPTIGDVYGIVERLKASRNLSVNQLNISFCEKYPHIQVTAKPTTLYNKAKSVYDKVKNLKRNKKNSELEEWLKSDFPLPKQESNDERALSSTTTKKERKLAQDVSSEKQKTRALKRKISELQKVNDEVETNFVTLEEQYSTIISEMQAVNEDIINLLKETK